MLLVLIFIGLFIYWLGSNVAKELTTLKSAPVPLHANDNTTRELSFGERARLYRSSEFYRSN